MILLTVTAQHIEKGKIASGSQCPIALAAMEAGLTEVRVGPMHIHFGEGPHHRSAKLPSEAIEWERAFDYGKPSAPITFEIDPSPSLEIVPPVRKV